MILTTILLTAICSIPDHPNEIEFAQYLFSPPSPTEYRHELSNGIPVYLAQDTELPLVDISLIFRGGPYLESSDKVGLVSMMRKLVRNGGTTSLSAEELDEQFEFLAAGVTVGGSGETTSASLNSLSSNFDESLSLFLDMVKNPGFQQSRIDLSKDTVIEGLKQRNDHPSTILKRESSNVLYGDSYKGRSTTDQMVESFTRNDFLSMHRRIMNPSNLIIAVSGDFETESMLSLLEKAFGDWEFGEVVTTPPDVVSEFTPGIYYVDQDVSQGGVRLGLRSLRLGDPDVEAATIMNYILGGGGFSSRITQTVRSDEGLAYSAGSYFSPGVYMDGVWGAGYESKNKTVALAAALIFNEVDTIKNELVSKEDIELAKSALVEQFPSIFQSKAQTIGVFVNDELIGRRPDYWSTYTQKINSITPEDVKRVANRILNENEMALVIVGDWKSISEGTERANVEQIQQIIDGPVVELPIRNPLTLEPLTE
ncbi:MAG: pitrilysin family protein [Phycisphaerales bacterium]|nr:pitrilysin family protein [Phycisphaerales bacterium]